MFYSLIFGDGPLYLNLGLKLSFYDPLKDCLVLLGDGSCLKRCSVLRGGDLPPIGGRFLEYCGDILFLVGDRVLGGLGGEY